MLLFNSEMSQQCILDSSILFGSQDSVFLEWLLFLCTLRVSINKYPATNAAVYLISKCHHLQNVMHWVSSSFVDMSSGGIDKKKLTVLLPLP
jgi:hypothetical protein